MTTSRGPFLQRIVKFCIYTISWLVIFFISYNSHLKKRKSEIIFPLSTEEPLPTKPLYPYVLEEPGKCAGGSPFLLLLIPSMPHEAITRDILRKTWANETLVKGISVVRLFLLGMPSNSSTQELVKWESDIYHDIIQQDFMDTYYNLTVKTLMGIEWVSRLCPNTKYVMKVDSDMFMNPWFLIHQILKPESEQKVGFFTGLVLRYVMPFRNKGSKWYIPLSVYSRFFYPPYCSGTGYVFSGELSGEIYKQTEQIPLIQFEDVYIGLCLEKIGIKLSMPGGQWFIGEREEYERCKFASLVTVHHYSPDELLYLWPDFLKAQESCHR
ncbi:beta-1,3-galactosyltransferase 2-like [Bombina bombina]|uniref:beta-1,3-galactosyltransferase 2-like n=1 Tax=Bombina bombina TaxID=8345 RepID=UPI00235A8467|nr:beta-1,3-galactosyltransferase 2-like [Bombina bombina]XP_053572022.1 beta-1,3-galactosyltransferase 2-like [Bombina bombina]